MTPEVDALAYHVSYLSDISRGTHTVGMHNEWSGDVDGRYVDG